VLPCTEKKKKTAFQSSLVLNCLKSRAAIWDKNRRILATCIGAWLVNLAFVIRCKRISCYCTGGEPANLNVPSRFTRDRYHFSTHESILPLSSFLHLSTVSIDQSTTFEGPNELCSPRRPTEQRYHSGDALLGNDFAHLYARRTCAPAGPLPWASSLPPCHYALFRGFRALCE